MWKCRKKAVNLRTKKSIYVKFLTTKYTMTKKIKFILSTLLVTILAACTSDELAKYGFKSSDLSFWEVKGNVKSVSYQGGSIYFFDEEGTFCFVNEKPAIEKGDREINSSHDFFYSHNDKNQINRLKAMEFETKYIWGSNGMLEAEESKYAEGTEKATYSYDENGNVAKIDFVAVFGEDKKEVKSTTTYKYTKFDKQGNWIEREFKSGEESGKQVRTIEYFEQEEKPAAAKADSTKQAKK